MNYYYYILLIKVLISKQNWLIGILSFILLVNQPLLVIEQYFLFYCYSRSKRKAQQAAYNYSSILRFARSNILKKLYYGLKDIENLLKQLYYSLKSIKIPSVEGTLFYVRVNNSLLILLSSIAKQLLASIGGVDRFNKKLLGLFSVLDKTIIP